MIISTMTFENGYTATIFKGQFDTRLGTADYMVQISRGKFADGVAYCFTEEAAFEHAADTRKMDARMPSFAI